MFLTFYKLLPLWIQSDATKAELQYSMIVETKLNNEDVGTLNTTN